MLYVSQVVSIIERDKKDEEKEKDSRRIMNKRKETEEIVRKG